MKTKLKNCPFCGSLAKQIMKDAGGVMLGSCTKCSCSMPLRFWNNRRGDDRIGILVEAMQKEIRKSGGNLRLEEALKEAGLGA